MKRISTLLLSAAILFGGASAAQATELKATGTFDLSFGWVDNAEFSNDEGDDFTARQRLRTQFNFITSENLQAVLMLEIGNSAWGQPNEGADLDADDKVIKVKRAYLDWVVPSTDLSVRMGVQGLALPSATGYGSPVFNADVAAVTLTYKFDDSVSLTGFWARPFDQGDDDNKITDSKSRAHDEVDMFGAVLGVTGEGWALTPWAVYADIGGASGLYEYLVDEDYNGNPSFYNTGTQNTYAWWLGTGFELSMFDPFTFAMDVMYGNLKSDDDMVGTRGWFVDARADYKLDWGTLGLFGWYGTGNDKDDYKDGKYGLLPVFGTDGGFAVTSFGFPGSAGNNNDGAVLNTAQGTWGIGAQIADMSFVEDLTHTLRVAYYRGTNDKETATALGADGPLPGTGLHYASDSYYLTEEDDAWEVNFDHKYQIYENLAAFVELGYINLDRDEKVWGKVEDDDAWKAQVLFKYSF